MSCNVNLFKIIFSIRPERFNLQKAWRRQRKQENLEKENRTEEELEAYTSPPVIEGAGDVTSRGENVLERKIVRGLPPRERSATSIYWNENRKNMTFKESLVFL